MMFISLEGIDGSGKSTQARLLAQHLSHKGYDVCRTRAPGATREGEKIREIVLGREYKLTPRAELFLFLADRAQHVDYVILPALEKGQVVICDRFDDSTIAFQCARKFNKPLVESLTTLASSGIVPALTIVIDLPVDEARKRRKREEDRIEQEGSDFHERVRENYLLIAKEESDRIVVVDGTGTIEEVHAKIVEIVSQCPSLIH